MQTIPFNLALPGMVLARDIKNEESPDSPIICGKGMVLTESLIRRLTQMGIQAIAVEGHPVTMDGEKPLDEMLADLDKRFRRVEGNPLMTGLKEIYRRNIIKSMQGAHGK